MESTTLLHVVMGNGLPMRAYGSPIDAHKYLDSVKDQQPLIKGLDIRPIPYFGPTPVVSKGVKHGMSSGIVPDDSSVTSAEQSPQGDQESQMVPVSSTKRRATATVKKDHLPDNIKQLLDGSGNALENQNIFVLRDLPKYGRKVALELVRNYGGNVKAELRVGKGDLTFVLGDLGSATERQQSDIAKKGHQVISEDQFISMLNHQGSTGAMPENSDGEDNDMEVDEDNEDMEVDEDNEVDEDGEKESKKQKIT